MSDFKTPIPNDNEEEMNPPTYDESISTSHQHPSPSTTQLHHQFRTLINQITTTRTLSAQTQSINLQNQLTHLTAQIDPFFTSFSATGLQKGTLCLIPSNSVSSGAKLADLDLKGKDEFVSVVEVGGEVGKEGMKVELGFWRDESMAKKLAAELQPKQESSSTLGLKGKDIQASSQSFSASGSTISASNGSGSRSSWWSRRSNSSSAPASAPISTTPSQKIEPADTKSHYSNENEESPTSDVLMKVSAEEVVFRHENAFGLFISERGYAIVMRFTVRLS